VVDVARTPVGAEGIRAALTRVASERDQMTARLEEARCWELETITGCETILKQILDLAR
jgi:hypothetical protein